MTEFEEAIENTIVANDKVNELVTQEFIDMLAEFKEMEAKVKVKEAEIKSALLEAMTETNTYVIDNDEFKIIRVQPKPKKIIDTSKLKEEGLYDLYSKEVPVNQYIKFELKYEED